MYMYSKIYSTVFRHGGSRKWETSFVGLAMHIVYMRENMKKNCIRIWILCNLQWHAFVRQKP